MGKTEIFIAGFLLGAAFGLILAALIINFS